VDAHRTDTRLGKIGGTLGNMLIAETFGQQKLDGAAKQLFSAIAEQLLGAAIALDDQSLTADEKNRVGHRFQRAAEGDIPWNRLIHRAADAACLGAGLGLECLSDRRKRGAGGRRRDSGIEAAAQLP
jgi:hypothetical protein